MYLTRRQRDVFNFISHFIRSHGYPPTLEEIASGIGVNSLATVHKHLVELERKEFIKRHWNKGRSIEITTQFHYPNSVELPLLGRVTAGEPIEVVQDNQTVTVPVEFLRGKETFVLRVKGTSMIDEQIKDGDYIIVERRSMAENGETVVALINHAEATIKKFYKEDNYIRLAPANADLKPIVRKQGEVEIKGVVIALLRKYP